MGETAPRRAVTIPYPSSEGRAVYVETGSLRPDAEEVDENVTAWGRLWETNAKRYTRPDGLRDLLRGEIEDYRHNYDAGYTLFTFLRRFGDFEPEQVAEPLFRERIDAYLRSFREKPRTDPVARFEQHFCDGADGRPASLDDFAALFRRFAAEGGSGATPGAPWRQTWAKRARDVRVAAFEGRPIDDRIYDRPTFQPDRSRSDEPDHGQYHTLVAARLLLAEGQNRAAQEALFWALRADEPDGDAFAFAAARSRDVGDGDLAWVAQLLAHLADPVLHRPPEGAAPGAVAAPWRAAGDLSAAYGTASEAALAAGRLRLARALRAEHDRFARRLALPLLGELPAEHAAKIDDPAPTAPELPLFVSLLGAGVEETRWAPLDSEPGPWHRPTFEALELGRTQQGAESSDSVRDAGERRVFVEASPWLQGAYSVRTRVRFLSAFATGELVIGKTHRDRGMRISFGGGDWGYAVGNRDKGTPLSQVSVGVSDLRPWGSRVAALRRTVAFESPRDVFEIEVRVVGPYVCVLVDGETRICHRRPTGAPIEGRVGFGLSRGIVRFEEPAARRHRVLGPDAAVPGARLDEALDPSQRGTFPWATITGRRVAGMEPNPRGTLVLWYPEGTEERLLDPLAVGAAVETYLRWMRDLRDGVAVHVCVPSSVPEDAELVRDPSSAHDAITSLVRHHGHVDAAAELRTANEQSDGSQIYRGYPAIPAWLMTDHRGVIRSAAPYSPVGPMIELVRALAGR